MSFTSWLITIGRNFEANPSTKSLFANTAAQCARRSPSSLKFPHVHELIDHPRIGDEIPDEVLVVATLLQRREPELGIELLRLSHFADVERVGTHFVECHRILLFLPSCRPTTSDTGSLWLEHEDLSQEGRGEWWRDRRILPARAKRALLQPEPSALHIGAEILALRYCIVTGLLLAPAVLFRLAEASDVALSAIGEDVIAPLVV